MKPSHEFVFPEHIASLLLLRSDVAAGPLTKAPGSGQFASAPAVWTIAMGKPSLLGR